MKKLLCLSVIVLVSVNAYSQIKIGETQEEPELVGKNAAVSFLYKYPDNTYLLRYRDLYYTEIIEYKSFQFKDIDNAVENLYQAMLQKIEQKDKRKTTIELPNDKLIIYHDRMMFVNTVVLVHINENGTEGFTQFSKAALDLTFGK